MRFFFLFKHLLRVFYFGHGKTYLSASRNTSFKLNIDLITNKLAQNCKGLIEYGIFYKGIDLVFESNSNKSLECLFNECLNLNKIYILNNNKNYESIIKHLVCDLNFIRQKNFKLVICHGEDVIVHENSASAGSSFSSNYINEHEHAIPLIIPPLMDFHSRFIKN